MISAEQLYSQLSEEELAQLEMEGMDPAQRYAVPSEPMANPVAQQQPEAGGMPLEPQNGALKRLMARMPQTRGKPIVPGLTDHSDPNASGHNWSEGGGV